MDSPAMIYASLARELRDAYEAVSPIIENFTEKVCPSCERVCCIDRHGTHEEADLAFLEAAGEGPPGDPPKSDDNEPCRHLGPEGCTIPRWRRPYRCTWYFCPALLETMQDEDPRAYRDLVAALERLGTLREMLINGQHL
jgi:hypothetical protein